MEIRLYKIEILSASIAASVNENKEGEFFVASLDILDENTILSMFDDIPELDGILDSNGMVRECYKIKVEEIHPYLFTSFTYVGGSRKDHL